MSNDDDRRRLAGRVKVTFDGTVNDPIGGPETIDPKQLARIEAAARSLRRRDREIYLAHRLDDMSYAVIARATGLSEKQVEQAMARAIVGIDRHLHGARPRRWWWPF